MLRLLIILAIILQLSACKKVQQMVFEPRPWGMAETPDGSPVFRQGWEDGCNTGLGVYGGSAYRVNAYKFRQDITQTDNPEYYRAWKDAYTYCRWYVWNWSRPSRE